METKSLVSDELVTILIDDTIRLAKEGRTSNGNPLPKELLNDGAIKAEVTGRKSGRIGIRVYANPALKMAHAYEFGSGKFRSPGKRFPKKPQPDGSYRIEPTTKGKLLAFYWDKLEKRGKISRLKVGQEGVSYVGDLKDGRAAFNYVNHPGVRAANSGQGYLRYGAKQALAKNLSALGLDVSESILENVKASFAKGKFK
jgi:hypothetical protein